MDASRRTQCGQMVWWLTGRLADIAAAMSSILRKAVGSVFDTKLGTPIIGYAWSIIRSFVGAHGSWRSEIRRTDTEHRLSQG